MITKRKSSSMIRQRGFSIVAAIFIIVILSLLGVYMVTIGSAQRTTAVYAVQGARAFYAARSGLEWGIYQVLNTPLGTMCTVEPLPNPPFINPAPATFSLAGTGLEGFQVQVRCAYSTHTETSDTYQVFRISATATSGAYGSVEFFTRTVHATVTDAP